MKVSVRSRLAKKFHATKIVVLHGECDAKCYAAFDDESNSAKGLCRFR